METKQTSKALIVRTDLKAGAWVCTGVTGKMGRHGKINNPSFKTCTRVGPFKDGPYLME